MDVPAGARPRPASALEGSRLFGKESSSPDPESGEQWTPFSKVNLVPGGKRTQGARNPALCCQVTYVCPCVCLRPSVFVCVPALSLVSFSSGASFSTLSSDLFSFSPSSLICLRLLLSSRVSVNRRTAVGATDESRPGTLADLQTLKALQ